jgi:enoyl-CoA hydratase
MPDTHFPFFQVEKPTQSKVACVYMNRGEKRNLMDQAFWRDLPQLVEALEADPEVRAVLIVGKEETFSIGLDFKDFFQQMGDVLQDNGAESREQLRAQIQLMQAGLKRIADSPLIFIAGVHGYCLGAGLDLIAACDLRIASDDALISLRETRMGIVADLGSLQRLPALIGEGNTRLMALTGRDFKARACYEMGLFQEICTYGELVNRGLTLAAEVTANPGITLRGVKQVLNYNQGHSIEEGLDYVATWNAAFLNSADFQEAVSAFLEKREPQFG